MHIKTTILLFVSSMMIFTSCEKKDENKCTAGSGGNVTLVISPKHHGKLVTPITAYAKYNTKDAPASVSNYDLVMAGDTTALNFKLTNLKCGDYYLFVRGYDTSINKEVKGGIPYTISDGASGEIKVDVPATE